MKYFFAFGAWATSVSNIASAIIQYNLHEKYMDFNKVFFGSFEEHIICKFQNLVIQQTNLVSFLKTKTRCMLYLVKSLLRKDSVTETIRRENWKYVVNKSHPENWSWFFEMAFPKPRIQIGVIFFVKYEVSSPFFAVIAFQEVKVLLRDLASSLNRFVIALSSITSQQQNGCLFATQTIIFQKSVS